MMSGLTIVFVLLFFADVLSGQEMVLKPNVSVLSKALGSSAVLSCTVIKSPSNNFSLHWISPSYSEITEKEGRVYVETEDDWKKVYITRIQESDAGSYKCRSKIGNWYEKDIELVVYKDITFDDAPFVQNPTINSDAMIRCKVSATPAPEISWYCEEQRIQYGERFAQEADGLRIYGIKEADNGNYTCRAVVKEDGRWKERWIKVVVHIPPEITQQLSDETGVQGTDLTMSCKASGVPLPLYEFFKDNSSEPIASTDRIHLNNSTGDIHFVTLDRLDEGRYKCRASNGVGSDTTEGGLRVLVPPSVEPLNEVIVSENDTAIIVCRCHGDLSPELTFHWIDARQDNDRVILTSPTSGQLVVTISNADPSDSGNFTCRANSSVGSDERTGSLKVEFPPRFHENQTAVEYIWSGKTRNMICKVSSEPAATIEWTHNGNIDLLAKNETFHVYNLEGTSYLQVHVRDVDQSWIYGRYFCRATNKLGQSETAIDLRRATLPDVPELVELVEAFPTVVILRASPPLEDGGVRVSGYRVEYEDKVKNFSLGDQIRIDNLTPNTNYTFRVRATNEVGSGYAREITVLTITGIRKRGDIAPASLMHHCIVRHTHTP